MKHDKSYILFFFVDWTNISALTRAILFCCALYIISFLDFCQWWFRAEGISTPNMNMQLRLFWSTWSRAFGPDSATSAGLAHGRDYSYCIASEHKCLKRLCRCSYLNYGNHLTNSGPHSGFFDPLPPDWPQQKKLKIERLAAATDISWHTAPSALSLCSKNQKWEAQNIKHEPSAADTDTSWNTAALQNTS